MYTITIWLIIEKHWIIIWKWRIIDVELMVGFSYLELLRKSAEHTLMDMVQLLFSRLPQFKEDPKWVANMKKV